MGAQKVWDGAGGLPAVLLGTDPGRQGAAFWSEWIIQHYLGLRESRQMVTEEGADPSGAVGRDEERAGAAGMDGRQDLPQEGEIGPAVIAAAVRCEQARCARFVGAAPVRG
jgi:hypothetical protein